MRPAIRRREAGFTLIELMISLVLFSFVIAGVLSIAVAMTRSFQEQRRAIATENAARAPLDFVIDAVRGASPGAPSAIIGDADTCSAFSAISITDNTTAPDELDVVYAAGGIVSITRSAFDKTSTSITIPAADLANFAAGDYVMVTDMNQGTMVHVDGVTTTDLTVSPASGCTANGSTMGTSVWPASGNYAAGSILVRVQHAHFTIAPLDGIPTLWMDPDGSSGILPAEPVAQGVEDMQVALGVDADNNGAVLEDTSAANADEWLGNTGTETTPVATSGAIRALKIVMVARDATALTGPASFYRPAVLNRSGSLSADNYRRRVLSSIVDIRNLTGSP